MTFASEPPDKRLLEITHFARYGYDDFDVLELRPSVLDTPTLVPDDYRTAERADADARQATAETHARGTRLD